LFAGAEQGQGGEAPVGAGVEELREPGEGGDRRHVLEDEGKWWVEATGG
jgi:hypothetical protein